MNKTNQFSTKAQYVTPSFKTVEFQPNGILCQSDMMRARQLPNSEEEDWGNF